MILFVQMTEWLGPGASSFTPLAKIFSLAWPKNPNNPNPNKQNKNRKHQKWNRQKQKEKKPISVSREEDRNK